MIKKHLAILSLAFVAFIGSAQDLVCMTDCNAGAAFSAQNINRLRSLGVEPPWEIIDFRWHKTEPILFMLSNWRSADIAGTSGTDLEIWKYGDRGYIGRDFLLRRPFTQLEVTADTVVGGTDSGRLLFWDIKRSELDHEYAISDGAVSELLLHPSGQWLLVAIDDRRLYRFDLESHLAAEIHLQGADNLVLDALAFSTAGHLLANAGKDVIRIWDTGSWEVWEPQYLPSRAGKRVLFTDDDSHLMVVADAVVSRWSLANNRLTFVRELDAHPSKRPCPIADGDISPDGTLLMTIDACNQSRAWDLAADAEIYVPQLDFSEDNFPGTDVAFSPDGRFLAEVTESYWVLAIVWGPG